MFKHYESSEKIFVDREEYLEWMDEALVRCNEKSVVLHLHGIGGIGKSSLLDYWTGTIESTIRLDCEQYSEFYDRLNVLAKGAVFLGVKLERFDVLWQIRQRFVEGVEPVKEEGRQWAKEIALAIPFIGSLASIGSAIGAVGSKVTPKLKGKYSTVGKWLQDQLGKDHVAQLLEILWKRPRDAEFLYLDALLEDINNRKDSDRVILFLMDHFEYVDSEKTRWRYGGKQIAENELWRIFLCSLSNCVGIMASRKAFDDQAKEGVEESELTELDKESCIELLEQRLVKDTELQDRIVSVSGGNPFVIGAICDLAEAGGLSLEDLENLRADTLEAVRLKTWRRLFGQAQNLLALVEKAGLVPFFNRRILMLIAPDMRTDHWNRLIHLSFVRDRGDETWVLHDLARELIVAELGQRLQKSVDDVVELLEESMTEESDYTILGLAISVQALASERNAEARASSAVLDLLWNYALSDALVLVDAIRIDTKEGQAIQQGLRGAVLTWMNRVADGEHAILSALGAFHEFGERIPDELLVHLAAILNIHGVLLSNMDRTFEAEESFRESLKIYRELDKTAMGFRPQDMARAFYRFGRFLTGIYRPEEALEPLSEAYELFQKSIPSEGVDFRRGIINSLSVKGNALMMAGRPLEGERAHRDALGICTKIANEKSLTELGPINCFNNLGELLRMTNRQSEAIDLFLEAMELNRELGKKEHEVFSRVHMLLLNNLAHPLRQVGKYKEAEQKYQEALVTSRELFEKAPEVFANYLAWTLHDYAVLLRQTGRIAEAEESYREALLIHRDLSTKSPGKHLSWVTWNLNNLGVLLQQTGRVSEALETYREALDLAREITHKAPEMVFFADLLATILNNLAVPLRQTGKTQEAKEALEEALETRRQLAQKSPDLFLYRKTTTLNNLGILLFESGEESKAEEVLKEALQIRRDLVEKSPDMFKPYVMSTLNNFAILLKRTGHLSETESAYREAIDIGEALVSKAPAVYNHELGRILGNYAILLSDLGSFDNLEKTRHRLNELGIESLPEEEQWSEEEEEEANPPAGG